MGIVGTVEVMDAAVAAVTTFGILVVVLDDVGAAGSRLKRTTVVRWVAVGA